MIKKTLFLATLCLVMVGCKTKDGKATGGKKNAKAVPGAYTEKPTAASVVEGPIKGNANAEAFEAKEVYFQPSMGKWTMKISDTKLSKPLGFPGRTDQYVNINLPEVPEAGKIMKKDLKTGDGFFQVKKKDGEGTTSWNASNSYYVEFTKWDVKEYDKKNGMFQVAGKASGKVYVAYKGWGDFKNSVVSGTFEDATVRYMGEPKLEY